MPDGEVPQDALFAYSLVPERIYETVCRMVAACARERGVKPQDVEDLQHDAYCRVMLALRRFDASAGGASISTWLYRHARGAVLDHLRRRRRRPPSVQAADDGGDPERADDSETPDEAAARREWEAAREECIESLPEPLLTRFRARLPRPGAPVGRAEAARRLGLSEDSMRAALRAAADRIRRCLRRKGFDVLWPPPLRGRGGSKP